MSFTIKDKKYSYISEVKLKANTIEFARLKLEYNPERHLFGEIDINGRTVNFLGDTRMAQSFPVNKGTLYWLLVDWSIIKLGYDLKMNVNHAMNIAIYENFGKNAVKKVNRFILETFLDPIGKSGKKLATSWRSKGVVKEVSLDSILNYFNNEDLIIQAQRDGIENLIPLISSIGLCPSGLKSLFGKSLWKKISSGSFTANKRLAGFIGHLFIVATNAVSTLEGRFVDLSDFRSIVSSFIGMRAWIQGNPTVSYKVGLILSNTTGRHTTNLINHYLKEIMELKITQKEYLDGANIVESDFVNKSLDIYMLIVGIKNMTSLNHDNISGIDEYTERVSKLLLEWEKIIKSGGISKKRVTAVHDKLTVISNNIKKELIIAGSADCSYELDWAWGNAEIDGVQFEPVKSSHALLDEGIKMGHCVASYDTKCRRGEYIVYSMYDKTESQPLTLGLRLDKSGLELDQLRSTRNSEPKRKNIYTICNKIIERLNKTMPKRAKKQTTTDGNFDTLLWF